jgi:DNA topoisomerase-1
MADAEGVTASIRSARRLPTARTRSSPPAAGSSPSRASCGRTSSRPTTTTPRRTTPSGGCRGSAAATRSDLERLDATGHTTSPPARYTEASLVKRLEELGIGRPSTYASIITTIQDRGYVWKKGSALIPTWLAFAVINLLEQHFDRLVDYGFTASLEDDLDVIAGRQGNSVEWLSRFYFGSADGKEGGLARQGGLKAIIGKNLDEIDARAISTIPIGLAEDGRPVVVRVGRYGPYVQVGTDGAEDQQKASLPGGPRAGRADRRQGRRAGGGAVRRPGARHRPGDRLRRRRPGRSLRPVRLARAAGGQQGQAADGVAVRLDGPRDDHAGAGAQAADPAAGARRARGRAGHRAERPLRAVHQPAQGVPLAGERGGAVRDRPRPALALLATPKQYGRKAAVPKPPLKELGADPVTGAPMVVKEGRFGPYVTDGETNASLRKGDVIESLTDERAAELLAERRARGPAPKKTAAKKAPAKKAPAKKATARKAPAKKAAAKKA